MISYSTNAEKLALQWRKNQHDTVSPKKARGGPVPGNSPTDSADDIDVALTSGEWVIRRKSARKYGAAAMNAVNEGRARIGYAAGGEVNRNITTTVDGRRSFPNFNGLGNSLASTIGEQLGAGIQKELKRRKAAADAARDAAGPSVDAGPGWGPIYAAMRKHGARNFNTYPGHHPSMAMARDVTPHNWAMANAAKALSSVWYVIYKMKIASKNHGNSWQPYHPISNRGDWRHWYHIHVARRRDQGGMLRPGQLAYNDRGGNERVLTATQNSAYERLVRVAERSNGAGQTVNINVSFPNYVGDKADLKRALVDLNRGGHLDVIKRVA
jgi:hypothetical protein